MTSELRPFVLKCPECGAPQPGPQSTCRYCKVPLMWAPSSSLSRDDLRSLAFESDGAVIEDEPDTRLLCFGPVAVAGNSDEHFSMHPQFACRLTHLWLSPKSAAHLYVRSFMVGTTQLLSANAPALMPGELFARGRGLRLDEAVYPGMLCRLVVCNGTIAARNVEGVIRVRPITTHEGAKRLR